MLYSWEQFSVKKTEKLKTDENMQTNSWWRTKIKVQCRVQRVPRDAE